MKLPFECSKQKFSILRKIELIHELIYISSVVIKISDSNKVYTKLVRDATEYKVLANKVTKQINSQKRRQKIPRVFGLLFATKKTRTRIPG